MASRVENNEAGGELVAGALAAAVLLVVGASLWQRAPAPEPPAPPPEPPEITVVAAGDILLGRRLGALMRETGDYTLPFRQIGETLREADIAFGNLEGLFCNAPPYPESGMVFRVRPEAIESLLYAGLDVVSVANNHALDGGEACLEFALEHLAANRIATAGAGIGYEAAHAPAILERGGVRFAFLAYTYAMFNDVPEATRAVVAGRNPENVARDVAAARRVADVVFVSLHDGAEYTRRVARETVEFARAAIDAGAAVVLGHHPHVAQRVERYGDGWIFYSLGNFVFQQPFPGTREALVARLTFRGRDLVRVEALPVVIEDYSEPRLAPPDEVADMMAAIGLTGTVLWSAADSAQAPAPPQ
jgi:poly-gamma-glutamate capsule biosynthesis protein CapA/YwtB (metallophosphatase superfamily)